MIRSARRSAPRVGDYLEHAPPASGWPSVSVVIPAHDEAHFIGDAVTHLRASSYPSLEIIVVADRCTDATADIVRKHSSEDPRVRLVELDHCPEGWSGKCHATWSGAGVATGEWILFTDADTVFGKDLVRASVAIALERKLDFLSLLGRLRQQRSYEKTMQPAAAMALMKMYPLSRANRTDAATRRPFANGQFMLFRRTAYDEIGGHAALRDAILEDLRFARRLTRRDHPIGVGFGDQHFKVRMYESRDEFRRGWKRIFIEAANRNVPRLRRSSWRLRALALLAPITLAALAITPFVIAVDRPLGITLGVVAAATIVAQGGALWWAYRLQGAGAGTIWRYPIGCWQIASILSEACADLRSGRGIEWGRLRYAVSEQAERG